MQARVLAILLSVSLLPVIAMALIGANQTRSALTNAAKSSLSAGAVQISAALDATIKSNLDSIKTEAQQNVFVEYLKLSPSERSISELKGSVRSELTTLSLKEPTYILSYALVAKNGIVLADTVDANVGKSEKTDAYFSNVLNNQVPYMTPVTYNKNRTSILHFAAPVRDEAGAIIGILRSEYRAAMLQELVGKSIQDAGQNIRVTVFDDYNIRIVDSSEPELVQKSLIPLSSDVFKTAVADGRLLQGTPAEQATNNTDYNESLNNSDSTPFFIINSLGTTKEAAAVAVARLKTKPWKVAYSEPQSLFLSDVQKQTTTAILIVFGLAALMIIIAIASSRHITVPIKELSNVAAVVTGGDLNVRAQISRKDEIGALAIAFNLMTGRLQEILTDLEKRVAERTKALSSVAEVSTAASTILDTDKLLQQVVDLAKERFNFYHAHVYLLNEATDTLVLSSGAGEVGRQMVAEGRSIPLGREQSLVARAAREKKGVTVNDVTTAPDFLPNPLLPNTHAELAVPMMIGDRVIGVFDVQSEMIGRFTEADIAIQTTLASQVASAIQNSRSFTEIQHSQAQLAEALSISRIGNWEYDPYKDIFTFNDQFYSIFRTTAEKVGGYKIPSADYARNFVHPDDAAIVGAEIQKAFETKERYYKAVLEHRIRFEDGETGYISVNVNVERDENGKITRWYGANQDITERRRLEELNRQRAIEQEAINQITQKIQSTTTIASALQVAARELGHALGQKQTVVSLDIEATTPGNQN